MGGHSFAGTFQPHWPFMTRTIRLCQGCSMCRPQPGAPRLPEGLNILDIVCTEGRVSLSLCTRDVMTVTGPPFIMSAVGCEKKTFLFFPVTLASNFIPLCFHPLPFPGTKTVTCFSKELQHLCLLDFPHLACHVHESLRASFPATVFILRVSAPRVLPSPTASVYVYYE